jgi:hypothetical protein
MTNRCKPGKTAAKAGAARGTPLLVAFLLFAGCATLPPAPERAAGAEDPLQPLAEEMIGFVTFVDPEERLALIRMRSAGTRAAPAMVARNEVLVETARLEPTRFQSGRTLGARIVSGLPNIGDEVTVAR